jgi:hypothetical protein
MPFTPVARYLNSNAGASCTHCRRIRHGPPLRQRLLIGRKPCAVGRARRLAAAAPHLPSCAALHFLLWAFEVVLLCCRLVRTESGAVSECAVRACPGTAEEKHGYERSRC